MLSTTQIASNTMKRMGLHVTKISSTLEHKRIQVMQMQQISTVIDVGANRGQYGRELRGAGYKGRLISFEPQSEPFNELQSHASQDTLWECHNAALGREDTQSEINISQNTVSSSLLPITETHLSTAPKSILEKKETIQVSRLDTLRSVLFQPHDRVFLKMDVQGFEKEVLVGASGSLSQVYAIEAEMCTVELYKGQALLPELCTLMYDSGFHLVWIERDFRDPKTGFALAVDGLFVRNDEK